MAPRATWQLEKYARYVVTKKGTTSGEWKVQLPDGRILRRNLKYYSDKPCQRLVMTLTDTEHLVICHGSCILESHSLVTARAWMRGLSKTDSLLLMYKYKDGTRRFRVKFCRSRLQTGSSVCAEAADTLSKFFPVKVTEEQVMQSADKNQVRGQPAAVLSGEVTLGVLAETLLSGKNNEVLSAAYKAHPKASEIVGMQMLPDDVVSRYLCLFLADPSFPALVEQVEKQLQTIINDSRE